MPSDMDNTNSENAVVTVRLVKQARRDSDAFKPVYIKLYPDIARYIFPRVKCRQDAEELIQDIFWLGYRALNERKFEEERGPDPEGESSFRAYLFTIARTSLIGYWRRQIDVTLVGMDTLVHVSGKNNPEEIALKMDLYDKINALPNICGEIVYLRYFEGFNLKEIAHILGISYSDVRKYHRKAKERLEKLLKGSYP